MEDKCKKLDSDQIEGAEFRFLGLETRFERNVSFYFRTGIQFQIPESEFWISEPNLEIPAELYFVTNNFDINFAQNSSKMGSYCIKFLSHLAAHPKISSEFFFNFGSAMRTSKSLSR